MEKLFKYIVRNARVELQRIFIDRVHGAIFATNGYMAAAERNVNVMETSLPVNLKPDLEAEAISGVLSAARGETVADFYVDASALRAMVKSMDVGEGAVRVVARRHGSDRPAADFLVLVLSQPDRAAWLAQMTHDGSDSDSLYARLDAAADGTAEEVE